jgi:1,4-dihydroxy-2-naphthoate octaprenyltransferase
MFYGDPSSNVSSTNPPATAVRAGSLAAWLAALRPRSLMIAVGPVLVGGAFAWLRTGAIDAPTFAVVLAISLLLQIVCNLQNDAGYTVRGGDASGTRTGLPRATALGWLSVGAVRTAIAVAATLAIALGLVLVWQRGWPVLAIGAVSLAAALAYMGGPRPVAYTPFGELTVLVFFGLIAVTGTDWVLSGAIGMPTLVAALAVGLLAAAALVVNNHRDIAHDQQVGRKTFAVLFGASASQRLYAVTLLGPFVLLLLLTALARTPVFLLPAVLLPAALKLRRDFNGSAPGLAFNLVLFRTFVIGIQFCVLLASAAVLQRGLA